MRTREFAADALAVLEQVVNQNLQFVDVERLGHVAIGTKLQPLDAVALLGLRGEQNGRDVGGVGVALEPFEELQTIQTGHQHIRHDEVGKLREGALQPLLAIAGGEDFVGIGERLLEEETNLLIIVNDQNTVSALRTHVALTLRCGGLFVEDGTHGCLLAAVTLGNQPMRLRQQDGEDGTSAVSSVGCRDTAPLQLDQHTAEIQSDTESASLRLLAALALIEAVEDALQLVFVDTRATVADADFRFTRILSETQPHDDFSAIGGEFQGIGNQVGHNRIQVVGVGLEEHRLHRMVERQTDVALLGLVAVGGKRFGDVGHQVAQLPLYGHLSRVEFADVEELSQQTDDALGVALHGLEGLYRFVVGGALQERFDGVEDHHHRGANLVSYVDVEFEPRLVNLLATTTAVHFVAGADHILTQDGLRIDSGEKLGKTIIFAKNHNHAEKIREVFEREYPHLPGFAKVIDNKINYAQDLIDQFSNPNKLPQIAISVDMLDTGIDVPECLNLVFFKKVMSKAKFWQMIGRGTRLCPGLKDGEDKDKFYIFDFCGNFEFFRMGGKHEGKTQLALQGAIFHLKAQIVYKIQDLQYQTPELTAFRESLVEDMLRKVRELNRENFAVRQHLKFVELFSDPANFAALTYENTMQLHEELAPLITPDADDAKAVRFDALMYGIELAYLLGEKYPRARKDLLKKVQGIASVANIPEIQTQKPLLDKLLHTSYLEDAGINEFEHIRESLRDLMKYVLPTHGRYDVDIADDLLTMDWKEAELENDDLKNYKLRAEFYVRKNQDNAVIAKLRGNEPLTGDDLKVLERILWSEVGTKQDYETEFGAKPLGEFVREIVGLDMHAAKEAFSEYLSDTSLDADQIYFVNQIIEYIVHNGLMKDLSVLQESPFTDHGSIVEVFTDLTVWLGIKRIIDRINANALAV